MVIKCQKPEAKLYGRIASDYYKDVEKINGKTVFSGLSLKMCKEGKTTSPALAVLDPNYQAAYNLVNTTYNDIFCQFVGLYADNDHLVAHATLTFSFDADGNEIANVSEILVDNKDALIGNHEEGSVNLVYGIYREMITFIEELIVIRCPEVDRIDFLFSADEGTVWEVTKLCGYSLIDGDNLPYDRCCFSKAVRERDMTRERCIDTEQE